MLVIVLDRSGLDEPARPRLATQAGVANESAVLAVGPAPEDLRRRRRLRHQCRVGRTRRFQHPPRNTAGAIRIIGNGGGTSIPAGLEKACEAVEAVPTECRRQARPPPHRRPEHGRRLPRPRRPPRTARRRQTLSTVGVGRDVNPKLLADLATMGKGRFYGVSDPSTLPQVFIKEARTIRRTLIREGPFTPWRLPRPIPRSSPASTPPAPPRHGADHAQVQPQRPRPPRLPRRRSRPRPRPGRRLGRVVAFTSDATTVWGAAWPASAIYQRFWTRAVRWASRPPVNTNFEVITTRSPDGAHAKVTVLADEKDGSARLPPSPARSSAPTSPAATSASRRSAPAATRAIDLAAAGNYVGLLHYRTPNGQTGTLPVGFTLETSAELRETTSDNAAMLRVVNATGGRMLPPWDAPAARLFTREGLHPDTVSRPAWDSLVPF